MRKPLLALVIPTLLALVLAISLVFKTGIANVLSGEPPLATLGNQTIREVDFRNYLKSIYPSEKVDALVRAPTDRQNALDAYLDSLAIAAKAHQLGVDQDVRFLKAVELLEMKELARLVTERSRDSILRNSKISEEEVKAYYEQHKSEVSEEPRFTAHHLLVYVKGNPAFPEKGLADAEARAKARAALGKLRAGKNWGDVTKTYSDEVATSQNGGLIRDGKFGYFPTEVEQAIKTQPLGKPGEVVKSIFGYHVLQVDDRLTEKVPRSFEQVKDIFTQRIAEQRNADARIAFMTPLWTEIGFKLTEAGKREVPLLDEQAIAQDEILATVGEKNVLESDFRWFLKDAFAPQQRRSVFSRPGARRGLQGSFLDMLVLEAKARKVGLDKTPDFVRTRNQEKGDLLAEFVRERDKTGLTNQAEQTEEEQRSAQQAYRERLRTEVNLRLMDPGQASTKSVPRPRSGN